MADSIKVNGRTVEVDLSKPIDISIALHFNGPQPNAFAVDAAAAKAIGDTRDGSSVNFEEYTLTPHCNGTHTECVGHITNERISVRDCLTDVFIPAVLISVEPEKFGDDLVLSKLAIESAVGDVGYVRADDTKAPSALIVRTLPNDTEKLTRKYGENCFAPYFTTDAMQFIVDCGFTHLLVDMPSIDRMFDEGKLLNHRIFWNVEPGSVDINPETRIHSTITELIYVPNEIPDGEFLLNLQIAPFESDAAPSRPILFKSV